MPLYQVVILSIVQSLTEFLPISSTAHLILTRWLLGWEGPGHEPGSALTFDIALHLGTLSATILYFSRDWVQLIAQGVGLNYRPDPELGKNPWLLWLLALATVPVGVLGYTFHDHVETTLRSPLIVAAMLIGVGVLLYLADRRSSLKRGIGDISPKDSLFVGFAQAIALIPGTSRSGITISAALARNINRRSAARFSFLLSTPALAGAAAKAFTNLMQQGGVQPEMRVAFVLGILLSALTGYAVIAFFLRFLRTHTLRFFVYYRIVAGIIIIALVLLARPTG